MTQTLPLHAAPSMSHYLNQTSKAVLDKYKGDLDNLREQAKHDPAKERQLIKEFKVRKQSPCKTARGYRQHNNNNVLCSMTVHAHPCLVLRIKDEA